MLDLDDIMTKVQYFHLQIHSQKLIGTGPSIVVTGKSNLLLQLNACTCCYKYIWLNNWNNGNYNVIMLWCEY